jgi:hypothetical protein
MARGSRSRPDSTAPEQEPESDEESETPLSDVPEEPRVRARGRDEELELLRRQRDEARAEAAAAAEEARTRAATEDGLSLQRQIEELRVQILAVRANPATAPEAPMRRELYDIPRLASEALRKISPFKAENEDELLLFEFKIGNVFTTNPDWFCTDLRKLQSIIPLLDTEKPITQRWMNLAQSGEASGIPPTLADFWDMCRQEVRGDAKRDITTRRYFHVIHQTHGQTFTDFATKVQEAAYKADISVMDRDARIMECLRWRCRPELCMAWELRLKSMSADQAPKTPHALIVEMGLVEKATPNLYEAAKQEHLRPARNKRKLELTTDDSKDKAEKRSRSRGRTPTKGRGGRGGTTGSSRGSQPSTPAATGGNCFNCGKPGHKQYACPEPKKDQAAGGQKTGSNRPVGALQGDSAGKEAPQ